MSVLGNIEMLLNVIPYLMLLMFCAMSVVRPELVVLGEVTLIKKIGVRFIGIVVLSMILIHYYIMLT